MTINEGKIDSGRPFPRIDDRDLTTMPVPDESILGIDPPVLIPDRDLTTMPVPVVPVPVVPVPVVPVPPVISPPRYIEPPLPQTRQEAWENLNALAEWNRKNGITTHTDEMSRALGLWTAYNVNTPTERKVLFDGQDVTGMVYPVATSKTGELRWYLYGKDVTNKLQGIYVEGTPIPDHPGRERELRPIIKSSEPPHLVEGTPIPDLPGGEKELPPEIIQRKEESARDNQNQLDNQISSDPTLEDIIVYPDEETLPRIYTRKKKVTNSYKRKEKLFGDGSSMQGIL